MAMARTSPLLSNPTACLALCTCLA
jgi:hypothetical protein